MIRIPIQGLSDGKHQVNIILPITDVEGIFPEFLGDVSINGELQKIGKRLALTLSVKGIASLECDYSLNLYQEEIQSKLELNYLQDTELVRLHSDDDDNSENVRVIREDDKFIDITIEVAQELSVSLPMKRIAPEYRDKDIAEIFNHDVHLQIDSSDESVLPDEDRWEALKKIKFKN